MFDCLPAIPNSSFYGSKTNAKEKTKYTLFSGLCSECEVAMASLSMCFRVDTDFFQNAACMDVDFFSTAKKLCVLKNNRLSVDVAYDKPLKMNK